MDMTRTLLEFSSGGDFNSSRNLHKLLAESVCYDVVSTFCCTSARNHHMEMVY